MSAITSLYIPHLDCKLGAEYVADVFNRQGIAQVSRVSIEPYKTRMRSGSFKYNRAYIDIKSWADSEAAYNFIARLRNPCIEARFNYNDDNWWVVEINKYKHKTQYANKGRALTIFVEPDYDKTEYFDYVDEYVIDMPEDTDAQDYESYAREIYNEGLFWDETYV